MMRLPGQQLESRLPEDDEAAGEGIGPVLALSDGVFAITFLAVIQIAVPATADTADVPSALLRLWPRRLGYALRFLVKVRDPADGGPAGRWMVAAQPAGWPRRAAPHRDLRPDHDLEVVAFRRPSATDGASRQPHGRPC